MTRSIVIASRNKGKIREIQQILAGLPVRLVAPTDLPEVVEDGSTYAENARKKAVAVARHTGEWALADDSGLEVDALEGAPGIHSSRWSGGGAEANNRKLLEELEGVSQEKRTARYLAVAVVAGPDGKIHAEAEGTCSGLIGFAPGGTGGFGFDPLFIVPDLGCTMAELPAEVKNRISHRAQAMEGLRESLTRLLAGL